MAQQKMADKAKQKRQDDILKSSVDDFDRFEDFFSGNLQTILKVTAALAIIITIGALIYTKIESSNHKVAAEITAAKTVDELKTVISKYKSNSAVYPASLRLATLYFNDGKYNEALETYTKLAKDAPAGEIKNRANLNIAYTMEALKQPEKAAEKFADIGANPTLPEYIRNEANFSAGRIYNSQKKFQDAKNCLKSIDFQKPGIWAAQGEKLLQRMN